MNWLEFFFGWLIKGKYQVSMLDGIIFFIEFMMVAVLLITIQEIIEKRRIKNDKSIKK